MVELLKSSSQSIIYQALLTLAFIVSALISHPSLNWMDSLLLNFGGLTGVFRENGLLISAFDVFIY